MKRTLLYLLIFTCFFVNTGHAQISLVGAAITNNSTGISIITWDALDSGSVQSYPTDLVGYYMASSVFDSYNSNYYLTGITQDNSSKLLSFNTKTLEQNLAGFTNFSNITEIDMSTGKIYNLTADSLNYFSVNGYDIETGEDSLLGVVYEPGTNGIVVDAIAFNSNDGLLYYLGYDSLGSLILYSVPVRDEEFSYTRTTIATDEPFSSFFSLNYDNVNNTLFALNSVYDPDVSQNLTNMAEIDPLTGEVTVRSQLTEFYGFVTGSACFDQNTGSYLVVAVDTNNAWKMMIFDTHTDTYITGWAPDGASEIVCDNSAFATDTYITTSVKEEEQKPQITCYPNPAETTLTVVADGLNPGDAELSIIDITGKNLINRSLTNFSGTDIDVSELKPGLYVLKVKTEEVEESVKIFIR